MLQDRKLICLTADTKSYLGVVLAVFIYYWEFRLIKIIKASCYFTFLIIGEKFSYITLKFKRISGNALILFKVVDF